MPPALVRKCQTSQREGECEQLLEMDKLRDVAAGALALKAGALALKAGALALKAGALALKSPNACFSNRASITLELNQTLKSPNQEQKPNHLPALLASSPTPQQ